MFKYVAFDFFCLKSALSVKVAWEKLMSLSGIRDVNLFIRVS